MQENRLILLKAYTIGYCTKPTPSSKQHSFWHTSEIWGQILEPQKQTSERTDDNPRKSKYKYQQNICYIPSYQSN